MYSQPYQQPPYKVVGVGRVKITFISIALAGLKSCIVHTPTSLLALMNLTIILLHKHDTQMSMIFPLSMDVLFQ